MSKVPVSVRSAASCCSAPLTRLIWKMTQGRVHVTDYTNASRTMLFNIHDLDWDDKMLDAGHSARHAAGSAQVFEVYGQTNIGGKGGTRIPIAGIAGDQQAALFGQLCVKEGMAKTPTAPAALC